MHTRGPWFYKNTPYEDGKPYIQLASDDSGYSTYDHATGTGFNLTGLASEADAKLIAESPTLLAELQAALDLFQHAKFDNGVTADNGLNEAQVWADKWEQSARAAIARAT